MSCQEEEKEVLSKAKLPPLASLIYPRRTRYGALLEKMPKPKGYLPKMHFPAWVQWPLHRKLPRIPLDSFIFSRGKLNQPLKRPSGAVYSTVDPHNAYNFLPGSDYNALHDPATQRYFKCPHVQKLLLEQGLITSEAEVICSQREINEYRQYLEHFQTNTLISGLRSEEERAEYHNSLERELRAFVATNENHRVRKELALEKQRLMIEERSRLLNAKIREDEIKVKRNRAELRKQLVEKFEASKRCAEFKKKKRAEEECCKSGDCKQIAIMEKHAQAELMTYVAKMRKELVKALKQSELMMAKSAFQKKELAQRKQMIAQLQAEREMKQKSYQKKMESNRQMFPMLTERRRANQRRILYIMRKFLDLWRAFVKRRKARRADPNHQSTWDVSNSTVQTVNELQEISAREKFDNFIFNLIKMKRGMASELDPERNGADAEDADDEAENR